MEVCAIVTISHWYVFYQCVLALERLLTLNIDYGLSMECVMSEASLSLHMYVCFCTSLPFYIPCDHRHYFLTSTCFLTTLDIYLWSMICKIVIYHLTPYLYIYTVSPTIRGYYVPSPAANPENPRIIDVVLKLLCMMLYMLKYASKAYSKDSLTH